MLFLLQLSPLEARQNPYVYNAIISAAIILVIVAIINFIVKTYKKYFFENSDSPNSLKKSNGFFALKKLGDYFDFDADQRKFLATICKKYNIKNPDYQLKNEAALDQLFKTLYQDFQNNPAAEENRSMLFSLRQQIEKQRRSTATINSSASLLEGQVVTILLDTGEQYTSTIVKNEPQGFYIAVPRDAYHNEVRPAPLSKITLYIQTKSGLSYSITTRVIMYDMQPSKSLMLLSHTHDFTPLHQRIYRRREHKINCVITGVEVRTTDTINGQKTEYKLYGKNFKGQVQDISGGGCSILANVNIPKDRYIQIDLSIDQSAPDEVIGKVIASNNDQMGNGIMVHVVFVRMSRKVRNRIFSLVYDY